MDATLWVRPDMVSQDEKTPEVDVKYHGLADRRGRRFAGLVPPSIPPLVAASLAALATVALLPWASWLAAVVSVALFVTYVPITTGVSSRLVVALCLVTGVLGALTVAFAVLDISLALAGSRLLAVGPGLTAAAVLAVRPDRRALLPRWDAGILSLALTTAGAWLLTGATLLGRPPAAVMGGLSALGWDHQSHFSMLVDVHNMGGVWRASSGASRPSFDAYPPLAAMLASSGSWLVDGHAVPADLLVVRYAQAAAILCALSLALLAWVAASAAEALAEHTRRGMWVAEAIGLAIGGYLCLGPLLSFFDYGFANFLLAVSLAVASSWLVLAPLQQQPVRAGFVLAAGVVSTSLLWTPLVVLLAPASAVFAWQLLRARAWRTTLALLLLGGAALSVALWQARRIAPDRTSANGLAETVGAVAGGLPPVPFGQACALLLTGGALFLLVPRARRRPLGAVLAVSVGALALVAGFAAISVHSGTHPQHSYYWAKSVWVLYIVSLPVLGCIARETVTWFATHRDMRVDRPSISRVAVAGVAAAALLWMSLGYSNTAGSKSGYVAVPPAFDSVFARWHAFRGIDAGYLVFSASRAIGAAPDRVPIIWDGGDLKQNRWLASLRVQLDARADAVYNPMPGAPYLQPAVDALRANLNSDPRLKVAIAYFRPESKQLLDPLAREFPSRVRLVTMG
jgi:hypothetical protein